MNKTSIFVKQSLMDTLQISKKNLTIMEIYRKLKEFKLRCPWDPDWHEWITMWAATRTQILYLLMSLYFFLLSDYWNNAIHRFLEEVGDLQFFDGKMYLAPQRMTTFNSDKVCNSANPTWVGFVHMYELCYLLTRDVFYVTFHWES